MEKPAAFVAVAGFAQFNTEYINSMTPYKHKLDSKELVIVSADTEKIQLDALSKGLSSSNVGQNPYEMGRLSAQLMYNVIKHNIKPAEAFYFLDFHYCQQSNAQTCTVNY